jgi:hypothetical protein
VKTSFVLATLFLSFVARAEHLYGSGIEDSETHAVLSLACSPEEQGDACTRIHWQMTFVRQEAIHLGADYVISKDATDEYDAFIQLDGFKGDAEAYDLEKDAFAKLAFQKYINGLAKHARKNFKTGHRLFESTNRVFFGSKDITASYYADRKAAYSDLQNVNEKKGWNWSSKPKSVSHDFFSNVARVVLKRALESQQLKFVNGDQSLKNYVEAIQSEEQAKTLVRRYGMNPGNELDHFQNGAQILKVIEALNLKI